MVLWGKGGAKMGIWALLARSAEEKFLDNFGSKNLDFGSTDPSNIPADPIPRRVGNVEGINAGLMPTRYVYRANIKPREITRYRQFARA